MVLEVDMKIQDAANILEVSGELTKELIKKAYRKASSKYHPDKGGSVEMMQAVNQAYEALKDYEGVVDSGGVGYGDALNEAINKIINLQGIKVEVCGSWVWVTGNTKPYAKVLGRKEGGAGFYYASKKKAWYFRPDDWRSSNRGNWSLDDIREKHGSEAVTSWQGTRSARIEAA